MYIYVYIYIYQFFMPFKTSYISVCSKTFLILIERDGMGITVIRLVKKLLSQLVSAVAVLKGSRDMLNL